jgi:hypothetical protein
MSLDPFALKAQTSLYGQVWGLRDRQATGEKPADRDILPNRQKTVNEKFAK